LAQYALTSQQMLALSVASLRNHVRMFAKKQCIVDHVELPRRNNPLLQRIRFRVRNQT